MESKSPEKSSCTTAVLQNLASTAMKQLHLEEEELGKVGGYLNDLNYVSDIVCRIEMMI